MLVIDLVEREVLDDLLHIEKLNNEYTVTGEAFADTFSDGVQLLEMEENTGRVDHVEPAAERARNILPRVAGSDLPAAQALMERIVALSPRVRADEAAQVAACVYNAAGQLRRDYRVVWPPLFNNVLINTGIRTRGLCFQWAEDLLVTLDALKLSSLELHWGEAHAGTWQESNCVVITAKGKPFRTGIIFDCWRHSGHPYWAPVATDKEPWAENRAYERFVRAKSAAKTFGPSHQLAFQTKKPL